MNNRDLNRIFSTLSTPLIADACLKLKIEARAAPPGIRSVIPKSKIAGKVLPARHYGSVDIFFEAMHNAKPGDVLVIDNQGKTDEACIGDLTILEAQACRLAGVILWGCHRDTPELLKIGFPVFSYGTYPIGPLRLVTAESNALISAQFGGFEVSKQSLAFADDDGALFIKEENASEVLEIANSIWQNERMQAEAVQKGTKLSEQFKFKEYLKKRTKDPSYTFGKHLKEVGGDIGE